MMMQSMAPQKATKAENEDKAVDQMVEGIIQERKWTDLQLLNVDMTKLLDFIGQSILPAAVKIEDQTYIDNAINQLRYCKAYDYMCLFEKAHNRARAASKIIEKLVRLRKEQSQSDGKNVPEGVDPMLLSKIDYDSLTTPFLYRLGDTLASYIEYNTDTFNNLKPFEYDEDSDEEEEEDCDSQQEEKDVAAAIQQSLKP